MPFTEFTCRSGGNNLYAGSLDGSAEASTTPLVTYVGGSFDNGTAVFTVASGNPVTDGVVVGHWVSIYIAGATVAVFVARITVVTTTTFTIGTGKFGTSPGTGTRTAVVGGAWAGPSGTSGFPLTLMDDGGKNAAGDSPRINFKNEVTYSVTAAITITSFEWVIQGYTTTFGDGGRATIDGGISGASYIVLTFSGAFMTMKDMIIQNNGATGTAGLVSFTGTRGRLIDVLLRNAKGANLVSSAASIMVILVRVELSAAGVQGATIFSAVFISCSIHGNGGNGVSANGGLVVFIGCVFAANTLAGCATGTDTATVFDGCVFYGNGGSGYGFSSANVPVTIRNCIFDSNGAYGVSYTTSFFSTIVATNNAFRNNTSGAINGPGAEVVNYTSGQITLTASPFNDPANGDFTLNNTTGGGALLRGLGYGAIPGADVYTGTTTGYPDVGVAQHADSPFTNVAYW